MTWDYSSGSWWSRPSVDRVGQEKGRTSLISHVRFLGLKKRQERMMALRSKHSLSLLGFLKGILGALHSSITFFPRAVLRLYRGLVGRLVGYPEANGHLPESFRLPECLESGSKAYDEWHMWDLSKKTKVNGYSLSKGIPHRKEAGTGTDAIGDDA